jgi:hypothetical protein
MPLMMRANEWFRVSSPEDNPVPAARTDNKCCEQMSGSGFHHLQDNPVPAARS